MRDGSSHHYKDPSERGKEARDGCTCLSRICGYMGDGSFHHYKDPSERGKKQEIVAPVYQGSGVKLVGDGSSHHYKDPSERGKSKR
jgi:hypothetical protein